jgi:hypothetical protein
MEKKEFEQQIEKTFSALAAKSKTVRLELTCVEAKEKKFDRGRDEPFALIFKGAKEDHLPDNTYEMTLEDGTKESIFVSAHREDDEGNLFYDAVFT